MLLPSHILKYRIGDKQSISAEYPLPPRAILFSVTYNESTCKNLKTKWFDVAYNKTNDLAQFCNCQRATGHARGVACEEVGYGVASCGYKKKMKGDITQVTAFYFDQLQTVNWKLSTFTRSCKAQSRWYSVASSARELLRAAPSLDEGSRASAP